jgi:hypothetical protein
VTLPVFDEVSGQTVPVRLDLRWSWLDGLDRDTVHTHVRVPHEGIVNSHSQTLKGDALVSGTVSIATDPHSFERADDAHRQQVKYGCQVISHPTATPTTTAERLHGGQLDAIAGGGLVATLRTRTGLTVVAREHVWTLLYLGVPTGAPKAAR